MKHAEDKEMFLIMYIYNPMSQVILCNTIAIHFVLIHYTCFQLFQNINLSFDAFHKTKSIIMVTKIHIKYHY